ncbi:MAG TPA: 16S rRNA (guanine(966)-N(2))-methyltransferase RsmD [Chloroflexi bacterium]|mgnify:CR=1 FL=1|nr:16S rRNA (guanine(966)-N(2))-methyltransferase RsmD [Chloroflexota bacterium]
MRVIAGQAKGRRLYSVPGPGTRPITDRAKTALFNILQDDLLDCHFLDLFAGTGQVGIEALSRYAARAVFVESGAAAVRTIRQNLQLTGLADKGEIVRADVFGYLSGRSAQAFDYIYVAPPQYRQLWEQTLHYLDTYPDWLAPDGWIIVQINPVEDKPLTLAHFERFDQRKYGSVLLCFYARRELPESHAAQS